MKNKIITIIALIAVLVVLIYGYEMVFKKPLVESPNSIDQEDQLQYKDVTYAFRGTLQTPTPCHTLETNVTSDGADNYKIQITTVAPNPGVVCAQLVTERHYNVSFDADPDATVVAVINGKQYSLVKSQGKSESSVYQLNIQN